MKKVDRLAFCLLLCAAGGDMQGSGSEPSERRAYEVEDYFATAFIGEPAVSSAGDLVAFPIRRYDLVHRETWSEIWAMGSDGSRLRQMTSGRNQDRSPSFSPGGSTLLFVSSRGQGGSQLWIIPVDGGEARQLTNFGVDLEDPVWSPDGRYIAVTARVHPECGADSRCNTEMQAARRASPFRVHIADDRQYRHWNEWRDGRSSHILLVDAATGEVVRDLTPGPYDSPGPSLGARPGYAFSPDGKEICYTTKRVEKPELSTDANLWIAPVGPDPGAAARCLTCGNSGWDGDPAYSPDGRAIAFRSQAVPGHEADLFRLALFDRTTREVRYLTGSERFDDWVTAFSWLPDNSGIVFEAPVYGVTPLFRYDFEGDSVAGVGADGTLNGWQVTADGRAIVASRSRAAEPYEIYRIPLTGEAPARLTSLNQALVDEVDLRPAERLRIALEGGRELLVYLVKPHGFDPTLKYPLILNVHGGPQSHWSDAYRGDWQVYPGKGYVVALPNPTGSVGFGQDFVDDVSCDWGGRAFRELMQVTDVLAGLPYVDRDRLGAMGWSYGGYMVMWFAGHTDRFRALASMMGDYDLRSMHGTTDEPWFMEHELCGTPWSSKDYDRWSPSRFAAEFRTPTLVVAGQRDFRVSYTQSLHFFSDLQRVGVPSRLAVFEDSGHAPGWQDMVLYYHLHLDWFHRWLGGGRAATTLEQVLGYQPGAPDHALTGGELQSPPADRREPRGPASHESKESARARGGVDCQITCERGEQRRGPRCGRTPCTP